MLALSGASTGKRIAPYENYLTDNAGAMLAGDGHMLSCKLFCSPSLPAAMDLADLAPL